ncbi:type II toxin-antitoxin system VapC family toxin [Pleurocapsa sp. PCC 7319]|uniref:type II toxin-antitoxin system VapC family toxin n=1 Tax=Pleurocapsa sp. PCC 7319 TaxID=118161 RepID=UPI00047837EB
MWIWFVTQEFSRFPSNWREEIELAERVGISPVSCYEVALAHQKGRLELPCSVPLWLENALNPTGIELLPLTANIAFQAVSLSPVHQDPFDRLIIATAIIYQAKLASIDGLFSQYPEINPNLMQ